MTSHLVGDISQLIKDLLERHPGDLVQALYEGRALLTITAIPPDLVPVRQMDVPDAYKHLDRQTAASLRAWARCLPIERPAATKLTLVDQIIVTLFGDGHSRPPKPAKAATARARATDHVVNVEGLVHALRAMPSAEAAYTHLVEQKLLVRQLRVLADMLEIAGTRTLTKTRLMEAIIGHVVGARLSHEAVRGPAR